MQAHGVLWHSVLSLKSGRHSRTYSKKMLLLDVWSSPKTSQD